MPLIVILCDVSMSHKMEIRGFEPLTSSLQSWRSSQLSYIPALFFRSTQHKNAILNKKGKGEGSNAYTFELRRNPCQQVGYGFPMPLKQAYEGDYSKPNANLLARFEFRVFNKPMYGVSDFPFGIALRNSVNKMR